MPYVPTTTKHVFELRYFHDGKAARRCATILALCGEAPTPWPAQVVRAVERLGAHVDKARIKRTLDAMIRSQELAASLRPRQRPEALERLKFWLGMPNQYYDSEWAGGGGWGGGARGSNPAEGSDRDSGAWMAGGSGASRGEQGSVPGAALSGAEGSGEWAPGSAGSSIDAQEGPSRAAAQSRVRASARTWAESESLG